MADAAVTEWQASRVWAKHHERIGDRWEWLIEDENGTVAIVPEDDQDEATAIASLIAKAPGLLSRVVLLEDALGRILGEIRYGGNLGGIERIQTIAEEALRGPMTPEEQGEIAGQRINDLLHQGIGEEPCDTACVHLVSPEFSDATMLGIANVFARAVARHFEGATVARHT